MVKVMDYRDAWNIRPQWNYPVRGNKQISSYMPEHGRKEYLMPEVSQKGMDRTKRYGYIFNILPLHGLNLMSPVSDKHKAMLRMVPDDASCDLIGEPADTIMRHFPESTCIDCNNHFLLRLLNYKCGT